ncbi:MAG: sodium:proton antiporter [Sulfurospirillum sp.]|nr:MAG: sodium:proton antiporter [Sulfurospirillum sp.]
MSENSDFDTCLFKDRYDAYNALVEILPIKVMQHEKWILLALSDGAVEITAKLANRFGFDFDLFFSEAIVAPNNEECQLAMVSETNDIVIEEKLTESFGISLDYIYEEGERLFHERIVKYRYRYRDGLGVSDLRDQNVLLIDEGCETGFKVMCALKSVINLGVRKVSVATPVIPDDLFTLVDKKVDKIYAVHIIRDFISVDYYYQTLPQPKAEEIKAILAECKHYLPYIKGEETI